MLFGGGFDGGLGVIDAERVDAERAEDLERGLAGGAEPGDGDARAGKINAGAGRASH